jgi:hypothetical protein
MSATDRVKLTINVQGGEMDQADDFTEADEVKEEVAEKTIYSNETPEQTARDILAIGGNKTSEIIAQLFNLLRVNSEASTPKVDDIAGFLEAFENAWPVGMPAELIEVRIQIDGNTYKPARLSLNGGEKERIVIECEET